MNSNSKQEPEKQVPTSYNTPEGVSQGTPPIYYPNTPGFQPATKVAVGGVILQDQPIEYNMCRVMTKLIVRNTGDRPIQIGSHFHFFEVNRYMEFDRSAAFGTHLNIPATTAIRFEPGDEKQVEVVTYSGKRYVMGFNGLTQGYTGGEDFPTYFPVKIEALRKAKEYGFKSVEETEAEAEYSQKKNS